MAGMGPAPKPASQRRRMNATVAMTHLPAEGRQGPAPGWPLAELASPAESEVWVQLWATPAAAMWDRLGWQRTVARYVRTLLVAEDGDMKACAEARQMEDRLGLNPLALMRLRWEVTADEVAEQRVGRSEQSVARRRLKVVDPDAVTGT